MLNKTPRNCLHSLDFLGVFGSLYADGQLVLLQTPGADHRIGTSGRRSNTERDSYDLFCDVETRMLLAGRKRGSRYSRQNEYIAMHPLSIVVFVEIPTEEPGNLASHSVDRNNGRKVGQSIDRLIVRVQ